MASHVPSSDPDSVSVASTPRSNHPQDDDGDPHLTVRFMCSVGGKIVPRPHDNQLRYVGGDTRIVAVHRHGTFSSLLSKLSRLTGSTSITVKYQLPTEDLDALITVASDEDVENMMEEYDRLRLAHKSARLRLFLFPNDAGSDSRSSSINSLLDGSVKRESWFVDALNGGPESGPVLERGRSEVSSIVSEVPDYLFGLENSDEAKIRNRAAPNDTVSVSDPGSPAPQVIPDLRPVKTRPVNPIPVESEMINVSRPSGYSGSPIWHYPNPAVQPMPTMYYMPGGHVQPGNASIQPVQIQAPMLPHYPVVPGQVPIGFPGVGQVYGAGMRPYEMPSRIMTDNTGQAVYYGALNMVVVPGSYPGVEEMQGPGPDMIPGFK